MLKTVSSIVNAIGALNYKGTWNASTNTPTLSSGVGTNGDYYVVSVGGSTSIDGIAVWGVGDSIAFNGTTWQRIEGGADLNGVNLYVSGVAGFGQQTSPVVPVDAKAAGEVSSLDRNTTTDGVIIRYKKQGSTVGFISTNTNSLPSDQRVKKNIEPLVLGLDFVRDLTPVQYNTIFQDHQNESHKNFGLIAQQVETALSKHGKTIADVTFLEKFEQHEEGESQYGLGYQNLVPVLILALQQLDAKFEEYKSTHP